MEIIRKAAGKFVLKLSKDRYQNLYKLIRKHRCKRIMEIGTWNGEHALKMIKTSQKIFPKSDVEYYGFDLFEEMTDEKMDYEYSKRPPTKKEVEARLSDTSANVKLIKGDTTKTLRKYAGKLPKMDFIFIDGGHSIKTIENDWKYSEKLMHKDTVVVFDDYFRNNDFEVQGIGCQTLIDGLDRNEYDVEIMKPECHFKKDWGTLKIMMVKVTLKPKK